MQVDNRLGGMNDPPPPAAAVPTSLMPDPSSLLSKLQQDLLRRGYPIPSGTTEYGSDVLLNNVVSMTVRPVYDWTPRSVEVRARP